MAKKSTSKPIIFISHISEEKSIAEALAELIRNQFVSMVDVFVSSIPLGTEWFEGIKNALKECQLAIVLASPESVKRPWINFESGAVWSQGKIVIPLCHSGITKNSLPEPLQHLQGTDATDSDGLQQIILDIAAPLGANPTPVDFSGFIKLVTEFESTSKASEELANHALLPPTSGLSAIEVAVLQAAAEDLDSLGEGTTTGQIRGEMENAGFKVAAATIAIKMLERKEFLKISEESDWNHNTFQRVKLEPKAWEWLTENQERLTFDRKPKPKSKTPAADLSVLDGDEVPF